MQSNPHCLSSLQKNKKAFGTIVQYIYIIQIKKYYKNNSFALQ